MKAYVVDRYKGPLRLTDVPEPEVGPSDVLIDVHATSINQLDVKTREGEFQQILPYRLPLVLGNDVAGVVTRVGASVTVSRSVTASTRVPPQPAPAPSPSGSRWTRPTSPAPRSACRWPRPPPCLWWR